MVRSLEEMYGKDISKSQFYARIVNEKTFDALAQQIQESNGNIKFGGEVEREELFISPTILDHITPEEVLMQEEIFGPVLPVMTYNEIEEAIQCINSREKPLALYSSEKIIQKKYWKKPVPGELQLMIP